MLRCASGKERDEVLNKLFQLGADIAAQIQSVVQSERIPSTSVEIERPPIRVKARRLPDSESQVSFRIDENGMPGFVVRDKRKINAAHNKPRYQTKRRSLYLKLEPGWGEHGWHKEGDKFVGEYCAGQRVWQGYASSPAKRNHVGNFDFYIHKPPTGVKNHVCWHHAGRGWYWVNFHTPPSDLLSGIKFIEDFLDRVT